MDCPLCKKTMQEVDLEEGLRAGECPACGGKWIRSVNYLDWIQQKGFNLPEVAATQTEAVFQGEDTTKVKICKECGHIMQRLKVGHGVGFGVDRCGMCGAVWLDKNEWEELKARNLHDDLHRIYLDSWQKNIQEQAAAEISDNILKVNLGEEGYRILKEFKSWYQEQKDKNIIVAYLNRK